LTSGQHKLKRIVQIDDKYKIQLLHQFNVIDYTIRRIVYGHKLYNINDPVQLVFDAANCIAENIQVEVRDSNNQLIEIDCKYSTDYLALKFKPAKTGDYFIHFIDRLNASNQIASSPYKITIHENNKEIIKSSGIYDINRLVIRSKDLTEAYQLNEFNIIVHGNHSNNSL